MHLRHNQMETSLYRIEEEGTNGWFTVENYSNLTKERASQILNELFREGYNPSRIRVVREE